MNRREFLTATGTVMMMAPVCSIAAVAADAPSNAARFQPYVVRFGDEGAAPLLFLHGGPGSNAFSFEATAALPLAEQGYRVVCFDQRGCGRSGPAPAGSRFDFAEAIADIDAVRQSEGFGRVTLVGHSFGGILALQYAAAHAEQVLAVKMVSTPLDFPSTLRTIRRNARARYGTGNPDAIGYLDLIEQMDPASLDYAGYTFAHGIASGLYMAANLPPEAQVRYRTAMASPHAALLSDAAQPPFAGFVASEHYTTRNFVSLATQVAQATQCAALCGSEDGLFDGAEFDRIRSALAGQLTIVQGASHLVFGDQLEAFLAFIGSP